jgi:hypothetical protein
MVSARAAVAFLSLIVGDSCCNDALLCVERLLPLPLLDLLMDDFNSLMARSSAICR